MKLEAIVGAHALLRARTAILHRHYELEAEASPEVLELAQIIARNDVAVQLTGHDLQVIAAIDAALERIADGTYGICEDCEERIRAARLAAVPWATRCAPCQQKAEAAEAPEATA